MAAVERRSIGNRWLAAVAFAGLLVSLTPAASAKIAPASGAAAAAGSRCLDQPGVATPNGGWVQAGGGAFGRSNTDRTVDTSPELDRLARETLQRSPAGFTMIDKYEDRFGECPLFRRVRLKRDGEEINVWVARLTAPVSPSQLAMSRTDRRQILEDGSLVISDDYHDRGTRRLVFLVTADGMTVNALAKGINAPDLSGWPTTIPQRPSGPAGPAPMTVAELERLALAVAFPLGAPGDGTTTTTTALPRRLSASESDNGRTLVVRVGDRFTVAFGHSNWTFDPPRGVAVTAVGRTVTRPSSDPRRCPAGATGCGTTVQEYRATNAGTGTLVARRSSCRLGAKGSVACAPKEGRWTLTVRVTNRG